MSEQKGRGAVLSGQNKSASVTKLRKGRRKERYINWESSILHIFLAPGYYS